MKWLQRVIRATICRWFNHWVQPNQFGLDGQGYYYLRCRICGQLLQDFVEGADNPALLENFWESLRSQLGSNPALRAGADQIYWFTIEQVVTKNGEEPT